MYKENPNEDNFRKDHLEYDNDMLNANNKGEDNFRKDHLEYDNEMPNTNKEEDNFRKDHLEYSNNIGDTDKTEEWFQKDFLGNKGKKDKKSKKKFKSKKYLQVDSSKGSDFRCDHLAYDNPKLAKKPKQSKQSTQSESDDILFLIEYLSAQKKKSNNCKTINDKGISSEETVHNDNRINDNDSDSSNISEQKREKPERELVALAAKIADKVKIISHNNEVYYYDGKTYRIIKDENSLLSLILKKVDSNAFRAHATKMFKDIYTTIKADERFKPIDYSRKLRKGKDLIVFNDCVLNIKTGERLTFSEEYLTFGSYEAVYKSNAYPAKFLRFAEDCSGGDPEIKKRLIQATGYLLMHTNNGKAFFVLGTAPNSGKSVYGKLLEYLVGEEQVCYLSPEALQSRFGLGYIQGKSICLSMDLPKGNFTAQMASAIKQITGGDKIYTEQKYEHPQNIRSGMRFVFASNFPVKVAKSCDDEAFWDRMVIVPFLHNIPRAVANTELFEELTSEKDDIISYCLNSATELIESNYVFDHCQAAVEMKELWRNGAVDTVGSIEKFANTCIDFTENSSDFIYTKTLYGLYEEFCRQMELPKASYNDLREWFIKSGCIAKRSHNSRSENAKASLYGIKIKGGISID